MSSACHAAITPLQTSGLQTPSKVRVPQRALERPHDWVRWAKPALPGVELIHAHFVQHQFERHWHETFSIGVTRAGVQSFNAAGTLNHSTLGKIMCFNPGVSHDGQAGSEIGFGYSMAYISADRVQQWVRDAGLGDGCIHATRPLISDDDTAQALLDAFAALGQNQESLRAETLMQSATVQLLSRHGDSAAAPRSDFNNTAAQNRLRSVRDYIHAHFDQDITVAQLSEVAGISRVHLTRVFKSAQGIAPHAYLNSVRIHEAKTRIQAGMPFSTVACDVGYADQSHFYRRFKGATGATPAQWKAGRE